MTTLLRLWQDEDGQDVVEYGLITALFSVVAYLTISATGTSVNTLWTAISSGIAGAA